MQRRDFVATAGTAVVIGLAGCSGDGDTDSPEAVIEAFLKAGSTDERANLLHPEAPDSLENAGQAGDYEGEISVDSVETQSEDVDSSYLEDEGLAPYNISIDDVDSIAEGEDTAHVKGTTTISNNGESIENTTDFLTATDGGDWLLLDRMGESLGAGDFDN